MRSGLIASRHSWRPSLNSLDSCESFKFWTFLASQRDAPERTLNKIARPKNVRVAGSGREALIPSLFRRLD